MKKITIGNKTIEISDEFHETLMKLGLEKALENFTKQFGDVAKAIGHLMIKVIEEMNEASKEIVNEENDEEWPQIEDKFVYIDFDGEKESSRWYDTRFYIFLKSIGNCYRTEEEAEEALETGWVAYLQAYERVKKYIKDNGLEFEPDWSDWSQEKYYIYYDHGEGRLSGDLRVSSQATNLPYFLRQKHRDQTMKACEADYLILLGVKK